MLFLIISYMLGKSLIKVEQNFLFGNLLGSQNQLMISLLFFSIIISTIGFHFYSSLRAESFHIESYLILMKVGLNWGLIRYLLIYSHFALLLLQFISHSLIISNFYFFSLSINIIKTLLARFYLQYRSFCINHLWIFGLPWQINHFLSSNQ